MRQIPLMKLRVSVKQDQTAHGASCISLSVQEHQDIISDLLMRIFCNAYLCLWLDASFSLTEMQQWHKTAGPEKASSRPLGQGRGGYSLQVCLHVRALWIVLKGNSAGKQLCARTAHLLRQRLCSCACAAWKDVGHKQVERLATQDLAAGAVLMQEHLTDLHLHVSLTPALDQVCSQRGCDV